MRRQPRLSRSPLIAGAALVAILSVCVRAQNAGSERAFAQSKAAVEKALAELKTNLSGRLPVLDGFAEPEEHPLDRYRRAYFQSTVQVSSTTAGDSIVRVTTKVTAWYFDPAASLSGYRLLKSNGRIEADLLDQLSDLLANNAKESRQSAASSGIQVSNFHTEDSAIAAPSPQLPAPGQTFSSALKQRPSEVQQGRTNSRDGATKKLQADYESLQQVLKNQAHPNNLVAVKTSGTPVVASPSLKAKPEFLASMHDEFELLDYNQDWVHVRISGLSRGWIWRNSVEMPDGIASTAVSAASTNSSENLFRVIREEVGQFPGDWEPLRNQSVKIISVQKIDESTKGTDQKARLEYTRFLLEKNCKDLAHNPSPPAGIVIIFDSADGGMTAVTMAALEQWQAGVLSDSALWRQTFFDPPETFEPTATAASE